MSSTTGFTQAELAAAKWNQKHGVKGSMNEYDDDRRHSYKRVEKRRFDYDDYSKSKQSSSKRRHRSRSYDYDVKKKHKSKRSSHHRHHHHHYHSSSSTDDDIPRAPRNPLFVAYEKPRYKKREKLLSSPSPKGRLRSDRIEKDHRDSSSLLDHVIERERWTHDSFAARSPSPLRERTEGRLWDTRKGAWKSRAGGVYLPPSPIVDDEVVNEDIEPARYKHPIKKSQRYFERRPESLSPPPRERGSPVYD